jgi:hypothetical protein
LEEFMAQPSTSLYVYYRIPARNVAQARLAAKRAADSIEAKAGQRPRMMRRPDADHEGRQTWMEVYEGWNPAWAELVVHALRDSGLGSLIEGDRHEELFIDMESPPRS